MLTNELKCIEIFMKYIYNNQSVRPQIIKDFPSTLDFERAKTNLFNYISINTLLKNYTDKPSFDLELFLKDGIIQNVYESVVPGPTNDFRYNNAKEFIAAIIEAIKNNDFTFDEDSNVYIASEKVETVLSTEWLYRFAHAYSLTKYQRMYLFNKKEEASITDERDLNNYLNHTKTFIVELSTTNNKKSYEAIYEEAENKTNNSMKNRPKVAIDEVIESFKKNVNPVYDVDIKKYRLPSNIYIIKKANQQGKEFYSLPLNEQKIIISKWIIEYLNCNDYDNDKTQEFLILTNAKNGYDYPHKEVPIESIIIGLFSVYLKLLKEQGIDFYDISLTDFNIKAYLSYDRQNNMEELKKVIKKLNALIESPEFIKVKKEYEKEITNLKSLDLTGDDEVVTAAKLQHDAILSRYMKLSNDKTELQRRRNELDMKLLIDDSDISFENDKIYSLLCSTVEYGRIYMNPLSKSDVTFEMYNASLGKIIFQANIPLDKLMAFVENNNFSLEENTPIL